MKTIGNRLKKARAQRGLSVAEVAVRLGLAPQTVRNHENLASVALENLRVYASLYAVRLAWLETGGGDLRASASISKIRIMGHVGAGAMANRIDEDIAQPDIDLIDLPSADSTFALQVQGDSALPRFHDGDYLLVNRKAWLPEEMINRYCVMDLEDGRRVVKLLKKINGTFVLVSQNSETAIEQAPGIIACYRIVGSLTGRSSAY